MSFLNCSTLPDHVEDNCNPYRKGGFPSYAVLDLDHTIDDFSNSTQWQANISAGKVRIVNKVKVAIPDPTPIKSDNPVACGAVQLTDGFDWTLEGTDANRSVFNDDFYTKLNLRTVNIVMFNCDQNEVIVVDKPVTVTANPMYPAGNRERQQYKIAAEWTSTKDWFPTTAAAPTGVFDVQ